MVPQFSATAKVHSSLPREHEFASRSVALLFEVFSPRGRFQRCSKDGRQAAELHLRLVHHRFQSSVPPSCLPAVSISLLTTRPRPLYSMLQNTDGNGVKRRKKKTIFLQLFCPFLASSFCMILCNLSIYEPHIEMNKESIGLYACMEE